MPLCTESDVSDLLSVEGVVEASTDGDDGDGSNQTAVSNAIERAESILKQYIAGRYDTTALSSNTWAKWACALIAAVQLFRRRGNPLNAGLTESWDELKDHLERIREGSAEVPDGKPRIEPGLTMSNLRFDGRYVTQKARVQTVVSSGEQQSEKTRRTDINDLVNLNL
jgi:hypothetical protein